MTRDADGEGSEGSVTGAGEDGAARVVPPRAGTTVGRYRILRPIGRGGMGEVYLAHDEGLQRDVAVKFLRVDRAHRARAAVRLRREAQAMARVDHDNVVEVYDVGEQDAAVYIAMEYVDGWSLSEWMRERPDATRDWREAYDVVVAAGRGLQAAHGQGIIHRDFKPDNVLVGRDGRVRVVDFGLARAAEPTQLRESSRPAPIDQPDQPDETDAGPSPFEEAVTRVGSLVGTPMYMAPEQHRGEVAEIAADIFAFCVTAYEALAGRRPFARTDASNVAVALGDPSRLPPLPAGVPPGVAGALLRGMRARADERWPTMAALLDALDRAVRPRRARRGWRWASAITVAGVATWWAWPSPASSGRCAVSRDAIATAWSPAHASEIAAAFDRSGALRSAERSARVAARLGAVAQEWQAAWDHVCGEAATGPTAAVESCLERRLVRVRALVDLLRDADAALVDRAIAATYDLPAAESCRHPDATDLVPSDPTLADEVAAIRREIARLHALHSAARYDAAQTRSRDLVARARRSGYGPVVAETLYEHAMALDNAGQHDRAVEELQEAFEVAGEAGDDRLAAKLAAKLAFILGYRLARPTEGERWARYARSSVERGAAPPQVRADVANAEALIARESGDTARARTLYEERIDLLRQARGDGHPAVAMAIMNVASLDLDARRPEDARPRLEQARGILEASLGPLHPDLAMCLMQLASTSHAEGDYETAIAYDHRALEIYERTLGPDHLDVAIVLTNLADTLVSVDRLDEARDAQTRAMRIWDARFEGNHPHAAHGHAALARIALAQRRFDDAVDHARTSVTMATRFHGDAHPVTLMFRQSYARALLEAGQTDAARDEARATVDRMREAAVAPTSIAETELLLVRALVTDGHLDEARARLDALAEVDGLSDELLVRIELARTAATGPSSAVPSAD